MKKRLICAVLAVVMTFAAAVSASAETLYTIGGWVVESVNGGAGYMIDSCSYDTKTVTIPESLNNIPVVSVNDEAFMSNSTVRTIIVAAKLTSIGEYAFLNCTSLTKITLPDTLTQMGEGVFAGTVSLADINLEETAVAEIPAYAFFNSGIKEIAVPESCTSIGDGAFSGCTGLKTVTLPANIVSIGEDAFEGCDELTIVCPKNSYAAEYAEANGIKYSYIVYGTYIRGDSDGDGVVSIMDATRIQRVLADFDEEDTDGVRFRGDVDGNGLDIFDATAVQRYLADIGNPYGIGDHADIYDPAYVRVS